MTTTHLIETAETIQLNTLDTRLPHQLKDQSGVNFSACLHCTCCASGCPFRSAMDYAPNEIIRLAQLGFRKEVLESSTIWICVGCNTCSTQCPQGIEMPKVMDGLRQIAIQEGVTIAKPDILNFHQDVIHTISQYGRTHKLGVMIRYKTRKWDWFSDLIVGFKMFIKGKLDVIPSKVKQIEQVQKIFLTEHKTRLS